MYLSWGSSKAEWGLLGAQEAPCWVEIPAQNNGRFSPQQPGRPAWAGQSVILGPSRRVLSSGQPQDADIVLITDEQTAKPGSSHHLRLLARLHRRLASGPR